MKIKSYFVDSVALAMDKARTELGADAVLISSRPTDAALSDLGAYEVVFGTEATTSLSAVPQPVNQVPIAATPSINESGSDRILKELFALRRQIEHLRDQADDLPFVRAPRNLTPHFNFLEAYLLREGFSTEIASELTRAVTQRLPELSAAERTARGELFANELAGALLLEEIAARLQVAPTLLSPDGNPNVMLVGVPGVGKTASLMKLALQYGLKLRRPVHLLSTDTLRIGGWEQLSAFARISGLDFEPLQHFSFLEQAVSDRLGKGLTLIDTPGFSSSSEADMDELARVSAALDIDVHLVLPATLSYTAAARQIRKFERFRPAKLLLTHTEEIEQFGSLLDVCLRSRLPVSFLACGQQIPEDLREADKTALMSQLGSPFRAISVAA